jgi:hypothetical protein
VNIRRNTRTCFQRGKPGHFVADCPEKVENKDGYKHKPRNDGKYRSRRDHKSKHKEQVQGRATIEEEGEQRQGPSDGWSERRRLQFRILHLELEQQ